MNREKIIKDLEFCVNGHFKVELSLATKILAILKEQNEEIDNLKQTAQSMMEGVCLLKEQDAKQYNNHEVACLLADLFGDTCACNFNNIDEWLPYKCDFRETCCPNPVGVACWEQYLKHKEGLAK